MPLIKPDELNASIRSGKIGSLYLFDGPENFLKEKAVTAILAKLLPDDQKDFNLERFDGLTSSGGAIAASLQSLPFLGDRRFVIIRRTDELSAADARVVGEVLGSLPETTCAVFLYEGKANLREDIPAQVSSHGKIVTFWAPFPNQMPAWLMNEMRERGKTITADAAQMLAEACADLQQLASELDKICLFVGEKKSVDRVDVQKHGLPDEMGDYKDLEAAIWNRDVAEALNQARLLAEVGVRGEAVFPVMERVFRGLYLGHFYMQEQRRGLDETLNMLGARGKTAQANMARGLKVYTPEETKAAFEKILQADYELKTGVLPSEMAVSLLLWNVVGKKTPARSVLVGQH